MSKKETVRDGTTIGVLNSTQEELDNLKNKWRCASYDSVVQRLLRGVHDVYVELISIDNELPQLHTVTFQLGEDKDSLYFWNGESTKQITLEEANKKMKEPKPNITFTLAEVKEILDCDRRLRGEGLQNLPYTLHQRLAELVKDANDRKVL